MEVLKHNQSNYNVDWSLTQACNFSCDYCHVDKKVAKEVHNVNYVVNLLNSTKKNWTVTLSGGEPMLHPDFVNICHKLTQNHYIRINTNLSSFKTLENFVKTVSANKVDILDISLHLDERNRRDPNFEKLKASLSLLDQHNFKYMINSVYHPRNSKEVLEQLELVSNTLDKKIIPKRYKGIFQNKYYPLSYTKEQKDLFEDYYKTSVNLLDYDYQGVLCSAGVNLLKIRSNGDVYRCPGDKNITSYLGNINKENVKLLQKPAKCDVCKCPCWGPKVVILNEENRLTQEAIDLYQKNEYEIAKSKYQELIDRFNNPIAMNNLAVILNEESFNNKKEAVELIEKAYLCMPDNYHILSNYLKTIPKEQQKDLVENLPSKVKVHLKDSIAKTANTYSMSRQIIPRKDLLYTESQEKLKKFVLKLVKKNKFIRLFFMYFSRTKFFDLLIKIWRRQ